MIECRQLQKSFGTVQAVKGVSMDVPDGTFLGLLGPNGAGKTTLMRMMTGLLIPDSGQVFFDGSLMNPHAVSVKRTIGAASQHINLDKELTVEENMEFTGRLYGMKREEIQQKSSRLLTFLGLEEGKRRTVSALSGGMKRKLMVARAFLHDPDYIFLDEPTAGIDPNARRDIWEFLKEEQKKGKTILLTSHYIEEVEQLSTRVMLMDQGQIFKEDSPQGLIREIGAYKVICEEENRSEHFFSDMPSAKAWGEAQKVPFRVLPSTLEDVFFYYTKREVKEWK